MIFNVLNIDFIQFDLNNLKIIGLNTVFEILRHQYLIQNLKHLSYLKINFYFFKHFQSLELIFLNLPEQII